jgi:DNA-binding CsgD family transcriptional regulator
LNRDRYRTEAFGDRGHVKFRLLRPVFSADARAMRRLGANQEELPRLLDAIGAALAVYDVEACRGVHVTSRWVQLIGPDPERASVEQAAVRLARHLAPRAGALHHQSHEGPPRPNADVRTALGTYVLSGICAAAGLFGARPAVVVSLERNPPGILGDAALRERFGLSRREVEVARLIATGLSNRAVAKRLGLSPHTVRHHGERVFDKLGVRTRADIAIKLRAD